MLASWPNAAFDLCGICCGTFMMPFWTFFGGTLLGKAVVKAPMQAAFFVMLFSPTSRTNFISFIHTWAPASIADVVGVALTTADSTIEGTDTHHDPLVLGVLKWSWGCIISILMLWFAKTIIEQLAYSHQATTDQDEINRKFGRKGQ